MENFHVDLTNCDREPIHLLSKIQSFGYLVGINATDKTLTYVSANIEELFGEDANAVIGKDYSALFSSISQHEAEYIDRLINSAFDKYANKFEGFIDIEINGINYYMVQSVSGEELILEFERCYSKANLHSLVFDSISNIMASATMHELLQNTAKEIKDLIGYERVMIYRFLEEGTGRVDAEEKEAYLEPFLNLHYPESDIPKQARQLYKKNRVRLVADVSTQDVPILTQSKASVLDMTYCVSRAVSPMHIQYLKNMGVHSSFSVSIIIEDELWGLVACHNYSPKFIDYRLRSSAKLIGNILSSFIALKLNEESNIYTLAYKEVLDKIKVRLLHTDSSVEALISEADNIIKLTNAEGVAICMGDEIKILGEAPDIAQVKKIQEWMYDQSDNLFYTHKFVDYFAEAAEFAETAAGVLITQMSKDVNDMIIWFSPEFIHKVQWAGKPEKAITTKEVDGTVINEISPRKSFQIWSQQAKNTSRRWRKEDINAAKEIVKIILETSHKKSKELFDLNKRLKAAYEELDTFAYTVSHDLKTPLTVIKSHAQILKYLKKLDNPEDEAILDNIVTGVDKMSFMMNEILDLSRIINKNINKQPIKAEDLINDIVKEVSIAFDAYDTKIEMGDTPDFAGDPVMVYQAFSNLISNAVKYSAKQAYPVVSIEGYEENGSVVYKIKDNGIGIDKKEHHKIFQLFKRMDNTTDFEGTGVGLNIVKRIMDRHEKSVWFESDKNRGSTFYLSFDKSM